MAILTYTSSNSLYPLKYGDLTRENLDDNDLETDYLQTDTQFKIWFGNNEYEVFKGTQFTYDNEGMIKSGNLNYFEGHYTYQSDQVFTSKISDISITFDEFLTFEIVTPSYYMDFDGLYGLILSGDDTIEGGSGNDNLKAYAGNDHIFASGGSDRINGGDGLDTFYFSGSIQDYSVVKTSDVIVIPPIIN